MGTRLRPDRKGRSQGTPEFIEQSKATAPPGPDFVDYEAFTAVYLPPERSAAIRRELERAGLRHQVEDGPLAEGLRGSRAERRGRGGVEGSSACVHRPVPGLYWARFAFPVRQEWLSDAGKCGAEVKVVLSMRIRSWCGAPTRRL